MEKRGICKKENSSMEVEEILFESQACAECTMNCLLAHSKERNPYCSVNRFFKVMLGEDFSDVLFLPPRFARTVSEFVDQETYLEDSLGQQYKVKFSAVDDSLAFQEGWHEFSVEHGLEEGDFLVFHHIRHSRKSRFVVHILGKSGCEKLNFPQENGIRRKRSRIDTNAAAPDEACKRQNMNSAGKQSSRTSIVSKSLFGNSESQLLTPNISPNNCNDGEKLQLVPSVMEEPLYMLNRDDGQNRDDRIYLYDLSSFEKQGNTSAASETNRIANGGEGTTNRAEKCMNPQNESGLVDSFPVQREVSTSETLPYGAEIDMNKNIEESGPVNVTSDITGKDFTVGHPSLCLGMSSKKSTEKINNPGLNAGPIAKQENSRVFNFSDSPVSTPVHKNPYGEMTKKVKKELVELREKSCGPPQFFLENTPTVRWENVQNSFAVNENEKIVNSEPVDSLDASTSFAAADHCVVVVDDQPFLAPTTREIISSMPAPSRQISSAQTGASHTQLLPRPSKERRVGGRSSSGPFAPAGEASGKQGYTSFKNDALGVRRPSKQLVASGSKSLVVSSSTTLPTIAASSGTSPTPAAPTIPAPFADSISPVVGFGSGSGSSSDSDSRRRVPTLSEVLESIRKKRKRDLDKQRCV